MCFLGNYVTKSSHTGDLKMARITIEDCLTKVDNRFELVILAAERTKQLLKGSQPLIDDPENKPAVVALREVAEGKVRANNYKKTA